jgi:RNA polymerase sigma-70 factor (ECF subfamily)
MPSAPQHSNGDGAFPETRWSIVSGARDASDQRRAERALSELCELYWFPLYVFVRRRGASPEDAEDAIQGFFLRLIERGDFATVDAQRGRLRSFLLGSLKNYLAERHKHATAQKRGGRFGPISFDAAEAEQRYQLEPTDESSPDRLFEKRWALTVLESALAELAAEMQAAGKEEQFTALQPFLAWGSADGGYGEAAARLGSSESAIRVAVHRLRKRFGVLVQAHIADTVGPEDLQEELAYLRQVVAS